MKKGFTLIELLLVIAIIAALAVVVFAALKPQQRILDAKNARRRNDVEVILNAVHYYLSDNKGAWPTGIVNFTGYSLNQISSQWQLGTAASGCSNTSGGTVPSFCAVSFDSCIDFSAPSSLGKYLKAMPVDPNGTVAMTNYVMGVDTNGVVTVRACNPENWGNPISVSR